MVYRFKKHIRKYITVVSSLLLLPIFSINSYAAYSTYPQYDMTIPSSFVLSSNTEGTAWYQHALNKGDDSNYHLSSNSQGWVNNTSVYFGTYIPNSTETDDKFYFPVNSDLFDYYLVATVGTDDIANKISITDFDIGNILGTASPNLSFESSNLLTDKKIYYSSYTGGYTNSYGVQNISCSAKLNIDYVGDMQLGMFAIFNANGFVYSSTKFFSLSVIVSNKGDTAAYNDIVTAINNQTSQLGGKLDGIDSGIDKGNDLIENGNSGTQSTITDFNEVFDDFNTELENIEKFDTEIIDEFESANETYLTELNNFSLSASLLNAGNWLSTSMQTVYDNSSDYKMLWLVPLLLGIPLLILFVRRGDNNE